VRILVLFWRYRGACHRSPSRLKLRPTVKLDLGRETVLPGRHGAKPRLGLGNARTTVPEWSGVVGLVRTADKLEYLPGRSASRGLVRGHGKSSADHRDRRSLVSRFCKSILRTVNG
jgi:hypothetical protein